MKESLTAIIEKGYFFGTLFPLPCRTEKTLWSKGLDIFIRSVFYADTSLTQGELIAGITKPQSTLCRSKYSNTFPIIGIGGKQNMFDSLDKS